MLSNSGRGGPRLGAGHPVGSKNQRSADIARQAADAGVTPLEVMLSALWAEGTFEAKREAARIARDAAPYGDDAIDPPVITTIPSASPIARDRGSGARGLRCL
jgi:hypothetical protein